MGKNIWGGLGAAAAIAGLMMAFTVTPVSAKTKACWAHYDEIEEAYVAVWADGKGHDINHNGEAPHDLNPDALLGDADSRADCVALFDGWLPEPVL
jgi:hypothetical protein